MLPTFKSGIDLLKTRKSSVARLALIAFAVTLALAYAVRGEFSYRDVILAFGALVGAIIVFGRERGIEFGFVLWALSLALGYRTIEVTPVLRLHPAELLLWLLLACVCAQRQLISRAQLAFPTWLWFFLPFLALGWWPLVFGDAKWDRMLNEFRDFLMLIPLLIVAPIVLQSERNWRHLITAFFLASTWIALTGSLEYWFPSAMRLFPAFIKNAQAEATADGFIRAQFSFWGSQTATFVCVLAVPVAIALGKWWRKGFQRVLIGSAAALQLIAIYIGGFRSVWFMVLVQVIAACLLGQRKHGLVFAMLCILVAGIGYQYIPRTSERVLTTIAVLKGAPIDHSGRDRMNRATAAVQQAIEAPLGSGWDSAGWVHSDFLQVGANLGIVAAFIFVAGYLYTLWRIGSRVKRFIETNRVSHQSDLGFSLLLSFIAVGGLLAVEGVEVLPQLILPVWFVWAMVEVWLRQTSEARELQYSYAPANLYPAAHFQ